MPKFFGEWASHTLKQTEVLLGILIDVATMGIAGVLGLDMMVTVLLALLIAAAILLFGSFVVFQEERRKAVTIQMTRAAKSFWDRSTSDHPLERITIDKNGKVAVQVPIEFQFVNHGTDAQILDVELCWVAKRRLAPDREFRRSKFKSISDPLKLPVALPVGARSEEFHGAFEDQWVEHNFARLPNSFDWVIEVDVAGPPKFRVPFAEFRKPAWPRWPEQAPKADDISWYAWPDKQVF